MSMFLDRTGDITAKVEGMIDDRLNTIDFVSRDEVEELIAEAQLDPGSVDVYLKKDEAAETYATKEYVSEEISKIPSGGGGGEIDPSVLDDYATKEYVDDGLKKHDHEAILKDNFKMVMLEGNTVMLGAPGDSLIQVGFYVGNGVWGNMYYKDTGDFEICPKRMTKIKGDLSLTGGISATNIYTKDDLYTRAEVEQRITEISSGGGGDYAPKDHTHEEINNDLTVNGKLTVPELIYPAAGDVRTVDYWKDYGDPFTEFEHTYISNGNARYFQMKLPKSRVAPIRPNCHLKGSYKLLVTKEIEPSIVKETFIYA